MGRVLERRSSGYKKFTACILQEKEDEISVNKSIDNRKLSD